MNFGVTIVGLIVALVACGAMVLILHHRWLGQVRDKHFSVWERLGKPVLIGSSVAVQCRVLRFIKRGAYLELRESELDALSKSLVRWAVGYIILLAITFITLATLMVTG